MTADANDPKAPAGDPLVAQLYDELRRIARGHFARLAPGQTLQATALVHEAWLKLADGSAAIDRNRFAAAAARAMRDVMIDRIRARHAQKRGAGRPAADVGAIDPEVAPALPIADVMTLDAAVQDLQREHAEAAELVLRRFFAGETMEQIAAHQGVPLRSLHRTWSFARAFLVRRLGPDFLPDAR